VHLARGVTTPQPLVTCPGSISALHTYHACRLPPETWPSHGSYLSQWFSKGGAYCRVPMPHARVLRESGLSLLIPGIWLWSHLSLPLLLLWGIEARSLHALTVAPPIVLPPPRSLLPRGYRGWPYLSVGASWFNPSQRLRPNCLPSHLPAPLMGISNEIHA